MKKFTLAYCADNRPTANKIDADLQAAGINFEHIAVQEADSKGDLNSRLQTTSKSVVLLVSDNFLKSAACMNNIMHSLQNLERANRVMVIIIDGYYFAKDAKAQKVSTSFERVSNVIQYMNYWQEQYLNMRKERRVIKPEQESVFNERLRVIRSISTEIGEFLRYLRGMDYLPHAKLEEDRYKIFFEQTGLQQLYTSFRLAGLSEEELETTTEEVPEEDAPISDAIEEDPNPASDSTPSPTIPGEQPDEIPAIPEILDEASGEAPTDDEEEVDSGKASNQKNIRVDNLENYGKEHLDIDNPQQSDQVEESNAAIHNNIIDEIMAEEEGEGQHPNEDPISEEDSYTILQSIYTDDEEDGEEDGEEEEDMLTDDWQEPLEETEALFQQGRQEEGLKQIQHLVHKYPENKDLRYAYANALSHHLKNYDAAIAQIEILLERYPDEVRAQILIGEIAELKKDYPLAVSHYEKALNLDPDIPGVDYHLGLIMAAHIKGKEKLAARYLKRAIKKDKDNADINYHYALLLNERLDRIPKAIKHFERTLELNPEHAFANYDLALIYYNMGQSDLAANYYEQAFQINPELKTPANDLAFGLVEKETAIKATQKITKVAPQVEVASITEGQDLLPDEPMEEEIDIEEEVEEWIEEEIEVDIETEIEEEQPVQSDKVVLITGATSGIGHATAHLFAQNGYRLLLTGRRQDRLEELQKEFENSYKHKPEILCFDVREASAVEKTIDQLPEEWKDIDILINNAGLAKGFAPIHEGDFSHWEQMIDTNIKGLLYMSRAVSPFMVKRKSGFIINVCSTAGKEVYPNGNVYCATKHAVDALTKSMRLDLYKHNIRVGQVSPAHVEETEFALVRFDGDSARAKIYEDFKPLTSSDVAEVIYFMATRPAHVNVQDVLMMGTQQAGSNFIDKSGR